MSYQNISLSQPKLTLSNGQTPTLLLEYGFDVVDERETLDGGIKIGYIWQPTESLHSLKMDMLTSVSRKIEIDCHETVEISFNSLVSVDQSIIINNGTMGGLTERLLRVLNFPALETVGINFMIGGLYGECPDVDSLLLPNLATVNGDFKILSFAGITDLDLPLLATVNGGFEVKYCYSLVHLDMPSLVYLENYTYDLSWNALDAASVNAILARAVACAGFTNAGTIDLSNGTNAAPTGQGLTDVATLTSRGISVSVNS